MFKHLKKLDVSEATSWIELPEITPNARILLRFAGEGNPQYYNPMLKKAGKRARRMVNGSDLDQATILQNRADDVKLFPLYVIVGWEGIEDEDGNEVIHNREAAKELCESLPGWIMDKIRNHAASPEMFLGEDEESSPDKEELAKN
jgi:hypothetical protein